MTKQRQGLGGAAESYVAEDLTRRGWRLIERNARTRHGEIDLIALDSGSLVFVEVKSGRADARFGPDRPVAAVGIEKQRRLRRLAAAWLAEGKRPVRCREFRFDVVGVRFDRDGMVADVEHITNAF